MEKFDIVVIGGGAAGLTSAKTANGMGKKVAIVEKRKMGGECTWFGCVPSKALIKISHVAHTVKNLSKYGLSAEPGFKLNSAEVMKSVDEVRQHVYAGETPEVLESEGIKIILGEAKFRDKTHIEVDGEIYEADKFIIATGSAPFIPPIDGLKDVPYLTNESIFELQKLPESLTILGAGPIGIELAQAMNRLGVKVEIILRKDKIMVNDDQELAEVLKEQLIEEGIKFNFKAQYKKIHRRDDGKIVLEFIDSEGKDSELVSEELLVAAGRRPVYPGGLEKAGIETDKKGVILDSYLRTTASNIFSCGDAAGPYLFSHVAEYQGVTAALNAILPLKRKVNYENIIWVTYTDPEFAHAGLTEDEAREKYGDDIKIFRYGYEHLDRAKTDLAESGVGKFILDKKGKLLGAHILGKVAGELIHEAQIIKSFDINFSKIQSVMHSYPTFSDITRQVGKKVYIDELQNNVFIKFLKKIVK